MKYIALKDALSSVRFHRNCIYIYIYIIQGACTSKFLFYFNEFIPNISIYRICVCACIWLYWISLNQCDFSFVVLISFASPQSIRCRLLPNIIWRYEHVSIAVMWLWLESNSMLLYWFQNDIDSLILYTIDTLHTESPFMHFYM